MRLVISDGSLIPILSSSGAVVNIPRLQRFKGVRFQSCTAKKKPPKPQAIMKKFAVPVLLVAVRKYSYISKGLRESLHSQTATKRTTKPQSHDQEDCSIHATGMYFPCPFVQ